MTLMSRHQLCKALIIGSPVGGLLAIILAWIFRSDAPSGAELAGSCWIGFVLSCAVMMLDNSRPHSPQ